ncbi:unnamed protein product [Ilex paraguariensis]|uniref:non-specific serine/threonine protein kinase n=1 Tax=Ilex paraguariensis TaxID=185542 RepID=A0ABC8QYH3_9AQUA
MAHSSLSRSLVLHMIIILYTVTSSSLSDSEILVQFKDSLVKADALSDWSPSTSPCNGDKENWKGVLCDNGKVWGLKLENMGLKGVIDVETLKELSTLRTISFMKNNFDGSLPNLKKLGALKSIYLSDNNFSGEIPGNAFDGMVSLKKLHLERNRFTGQIPESLGMLPKLTELMLEDNEFRGEIPEFRQDRLKMVNMSNNDLEGPILGSLSKLNVSSFSGNKDLCGHPLESCAASRKLSVGTILVVVVVVVVALAAIVAVFIILRRQGQRPQPEETSLPSQAHKKAASADLDKMEQGGLPDGKRSEQGGKLSFLRDERDKFELADLLRASAEILGSGVFGSTYKAAVMMGSVMVVKRHRKMNNVGKEEFQEHMRRLGRLSHPNLLPLVAYYYRKEEKLLVSDYVDNVSVAVHLHGNHSSGQPSLDWPTRLKIIKGVARGLSYLYNELPSLIVPHGHLKASNVLLDESFNPILTDYGLIPVVNHEHAQDLMIAYKSPEYKQHGRITKKTDVWSLGILILEILTGKFPSNYFRPAGKGDDTDLGSWVISIFQGETTSEVFDKEMGGVKNSEGEMVKLLKIGLSCCESEMEKRLDIKEAVERIEEVRERDGDEEFYSSYTSEGDMRSSRGLSDDFSLSMNG